MPGCGACGGSGTCRGCKGSGKIGGVTCGLCGGSGRCNTCGGAGKASTPSRLADDTLDEITAFEADADVGDDKPEDY